MKVNDSGGFERKLVSAGMHLAVCYQLVDLGTAINSFGNSSHNIQIGWEILDETYEFEDKEGEKKEFNFLVYKEYSASLREETYLRLDLESWRSRDFTAKELEGFELKNILGSVCQLNIKHKISKKGKAYAKIVSVNPAPKGDASKGKFQSLI